MFEICTCGDARDEHEGGYAQCFAGGESGQGCPCIHFEADEDDES